MAMIEPVALNDPVHHCVQQLLKVIVLDEEFAVDKVDYV
jgi:hypothetical protein